MIINQWSLQAGCTVQQWREKERERDVILLKTGPRRPDIIFVKHDSSIVRPVCGYSMMEQVRLCAVWPMDNLLGSSMNHIQGWMTVWQCCCPDLENGCLSTTTTRVKILEVIWQARASPTVVPAPVREGEGEGDENPIHLLLRSFAILFVRQSLSAFLASRRGKGNSAILAPV